VNGTFPAAPASGRNADQKRRTDLRFAIAFLVEHDEEFAAGAILPAQTRVRVDDQQLSSDHGW